MLLFLDGFAHYDDISFFSKKWTSLVAPQGAPNAWSITPDGRLSNCLQFLIPGGSSSNAGSVGLVPLATQYGTWTPTRSGVCGFALKVSDVLRLGTSDPNRTLIEWIAPNNFRGLDVELVPGGTFNVNRWDFDPNYKRTVLAISAEGIVDDTYMYVECKWQLGNADGFVEIRVNTIPVLRFDGDTLSSFWTPLQWNRMNFLSLRANTGNDDFYVRMCDFYLADLEDGPGSYEVDDFVGDAVIDMIRPDGVGNSTGWTPIPANPNWENVREVPPDGDTTRIEGTAIGTRDTYTFEDIPADPFGIQVVAYARKDGPGQALIQPVVRQGAVDFDGITLGVADPLDYTFVHWPYDNNPATGAQWTVAEVNAAEFGPLKVG